jgi:N-methylhydantoinase A
LSSRVAVDVGGTFTDIVVLDERTSELRVGKVPSTPKDPMHGVMDAVRSLGVDLSEVALFSHGTTVGTNALITRSFPAAAMVTTEGFRDVLEIRRGTKEDLWDAYKDVSGPYIRRRDRLEVSERVDYSGKIVKPLDEEGAREVARILRVREVESVAVCFINAHANPENERRMRDLLVEELPGVTICASSDILPEIFEYERFSTTATNAVLSPLISGYVNRLEVELRADGYEGDLLLLHSGGGVMTGATAGRYAVRMAASGLAAGAIACRHLAKLAGHENAIGLDMGGTSTDISQVYEGEMRSTNEWSVEFGHPLLVPSIEILTIGAGGGSLAWIDDAGGLRNGPQSAGAAPGPVCYRQGGSEPTNTDANLVLGRLGPGLLGGSLTLDVEAARGAIEAKIAEPLGMDSAEAASAILTVANANMADAVRLISIRRGYDPRDFALVVFGGAGPLHGAALAKELSIPTVIVPPNPGIASALGCLLVDIRHDLSAMYLEPFADVDTADLEHEFLALEDEAKERLDAEGVPESQLSLSRQIAMRYVGQWRSLTLELDGLSGRYDGLIEEFHQEHERQFAYSRPGAPVEIYQLAVRAVGISPKPELQRAEAGTNTTPSPSHSRDVWFSDSGGYISTPVYDRARFHAGTELEGPAVIEQLDSTVVVPPAVRARVDEWHIIHMDFLEGAP